MQARAFTILRGRPASLQYTASAQEFDMETRKGVQYGVHNGTVLLGDLYMAQGGDSPPVIVAIHGGGWQAGSRDIYRFMGHIWPNTVMQYSASTTA
jgi:acetyl esterase/lipase